MDFPWLGDGLFLFCCFVFGCLGCNGLGFASWVVSGVLGVFSDFAC